MPQCQFPPLFVLSGKKDRMLQLEYEKVRDDIEVNKTRIAETEAKLSDVKRGREDEDGERANKLARLEELKKKKMSMESELKSLKENDPQALANLEKELKLVTESANRWTENIFSVSIYSFQSTFLNALKKRILFFITYLTLYFCRVNPI